MGFVGGRWVWGEESMVGRRARWVGVVGVSGLENCVRVFEIVGVVVRL